jgi:hypothetical protein
MDAAGILLLLYTAAASLWLGAGLNQLVVMGATLVAAGPDAAPFVRALARRRGSGLFFAAIAFVTTILGVLAYFASGALTAPATAPNVALGLAVLATLAALARGATANRVAEARVLEAALHGTPQEMAELAAKAHRVNKTTIGVLAVAALALLVSRALA